MVSLPSKTIGSRGWFKTTYPSNQSRPYRDPLPYSAYGTSCNFYPNSSGEFSTNSLGMVQGYVADQSRWARAARAQAYDKLVGKLRGDASAMLAVNVAERGQSLDMIAKRGGQLLKAVRSFRKFDIPDALGHLGFSFRPGTKRREATWVRLGKGKTYSLPAARVDRDTYLLRRRVKRVGSLWLEYHFGWSPLLSDIHNAVDVLQDKQYAFRNVYSASATANRNDRNVQDWYYRSEWWRDSGTWDGTYGCRYQCTMSISSPNLLKANRLGLVNPASVAWELIPFSFLVDWFLPVGKFLESYTDTVGMQLDKIQRMERREATHTYASTFSGVSEQDQAFSVQRTLHHSLPIPGLMDRRGTGIASLSRAATAISLLTGFLKTSKWS